MMNGSERQALLERLASRVSAGEVVFFIGAGFSLDAEGNSAKLLIARLLVRFEALCEALNGAGNAPQQAAARTLRRNLRNTFGLCDARDPDIAVPDLFDGRIDEHLYTLSQSYFQINDWLCVAFDELLRQLSAHEPAALAARVKAHERCLLKALKRHPKWQDKEVHLGVLDLALLLPFWRYCEAVPVMRTERALAGKVLFLDTMGFDDRTVMSGAPMDRDMQAVLRGAGRLTERHHALAWLAAEGLCPVVVTTNFDLLLESAYRLAGLLPWNAPASDWKDGLEQLDGDQQIRVPQNRRYSHFARIAEAWQFFNHAKADRAAHLYKIHGCADAYRSARKLALKEDGKGGGFATLRDLLPTIVFTYREIQNWRQDAWSRDHLNTLLRTRTIVFSGYSVADPVIHDTFRNIYEEMAGLRLAARDLEQVLPGVSNQKRRPAAADGKAAPAFVMGLEAEFHGMQILRAASLAAGERPPDLGSHPNLLTFFLLDKQRVPNLDDCYRLLYHDCARELQAKAVKTQLLHVQYQLAGQRCPASEAEAIVAEFEAMRRHERAEAAAALEGTAEPALRQRLLDLTGWTWHFQRGLMREYALAASFLSAPGEALSIERVARLPWYCPLSEHADWTAWGVVIEIALRKAHARLRELGHFGELRPLAHTAPAVDIVQGGVRRALSIELASMGRIYKRPLPRSLRALAPLRWDLRNQTVPWWRQGDGMKPTTTPSASLLWRWAAWPTAQWGADESPHRYFGMDSPDGGDDGQAR